MSGEDNAADTHLDRDANAIAGGNSTVNARTKGIFDASDGQQGHGEAIVHGIIV